MAERNLDQSNWRLPLSREPRQTDLFSNIIANVRCKFVKKMERMSDTFVIWGKPNNHPIRVTIYIRHALDLSSSFGQVMLIDADGIAPDDSSFGCASKVA
ncbi:hypothetical protein K4K54_008560 [Colletotrichum sp. SAR 10_86]|nr:hypothetical protein K4K52_006692 [Colletotrichum sp. SAR 10_76]KAI8234375.1 hypothetical protein K4K54_008560 [Colletotrichum sp. SAR 10_86]